MECQFYAYAPSYNLIRKRGMRRINLRVNNGGEIAVSAPHGVAKYRIDRFVKSNKDWIDQQLSKQIDLNKPSQKIGDIALKVVAGSAKGDSVSYDPVKREVICYMAQNHWQEENVKILMTKFLKKRSQLAFPDQIKTLAARIQQQVNRVTVKATTARWGSCSSQGNINISMYTYLLPQNLQYYIISHEVAHLKHLNHSQDFWNTVEILDPNYQAARQQMREFSQILGCFN